MCLCECKGMKIFEGINGLVNTYIACNNQVFQSVLEIRPIVPQDKIDILIPWLDRIRTSYGHTECESNS